jgi:hypothetical protein
MATPFPQRLELRKLLQDRSGGLDMGSLDQSWQVASGPVGVDWQPKGRDPFRAIASQRIQQSRLRQRSGSCVAQVGS